MPFLTVLLQTPIGDPNQFNNFLIFGFVVSWLIGMSYLLYLNNSQRNIEKDIELLKRLLDDDDQ